MNRFDLGSMLLRLAIGGLMLPHGIHKVLHGLAGVEKQLTDKGLPLALSHGVYFGEVVAPILILIGVLVRPAAAIVAVNMVFAVALAHGGDLLAFGKGGGYKLELQALYFLGALSLALTGGGHLTATRPFKSDGRRQSA